MSKAKKGSKGFIKIVHVTSVDFIKKIIIIICVLKMNKGLMGYEFSFLGELSI